MIKLLVIALIVYLVIAIMFYFLQHFAFFRPEILPHHFTYKYDFPFEEKHFEMEDGGTLNAIHFKVPNSLGVVFYLKGNSKSIKGWGKFAKDYLGKGFDFFMIDYRGFGKSKGKRTERTLYSDAQYIYKYLVGKYGESKLTIIGRSFGSGIAARIASWNNPRLLILDSPYYNFEYRIRQFGGKFFPLKWLLRYKIPTNKFLKKVTCPIHIIHGDKDRLIPYSDSEKLLEELGEKIQLHRIEGGRHNNLPDFASFHKVLYQILTDKLEK